eukprot:TRINITY_DN579_c1_g1_i1.p1 TRINITY_DN579_c1_g1~~TRINITY_DN579_c1_g1_i1.p1  ORF type:complete len:397 (+),score=131.85 TRINITY_DN579_c1_g1_i1:64-1254(+)
MTSTLVSSDLKQKLLSDEEHVATRNYNSLDEQNRKDFDSNHERKENKIIIVQEKGASSSSSMYSVSSSSSSSSSSSASFFSASVSSSSSSSSSLSTPDILERERKMAIDDDSVKPYLFHQHLAQDTSGCAAFWCCLWCFQPTSVQISSFDLTKRQKDTIEELKKASAIIYDEKDETHTAALLRLGNAVFGKTNFSQQLINPQWKTIGFQGDNPSTDFRGSGLFGKTNFSQQLINPQWKTIGFQGDNPSTDFRGSGLFGLQNLIYFVHQFPTAFHRMCDRKCDVEHYLPVAITGLNLTFLLIQLFSLQLPWSARISKSQLTAFSVFVDLLYVNENAFQEIYCLLFLLLESIWEERDARYIEFSLVLNEVKARMHAAFTRRPRDLKELRCLLGLQMSA